jgi:hypothetical protein
MRTPLAVLTLTILAAAALYRPQTGRSQPASEEAAAQFRVVIGLTDQEPRDVQGKVTVRGGSLAGIDGWRFSGDDLASPDGSFRFRTKVGNLENQLRGQDYGQTDWNDPPSAG